MAKNICKCNPGQGLKPVGIMLVAQAVFAGVNVLYKLAVIDGMSTTVLISYRYIFATVVMVPLALIFERKGKGKLTWKIAIQGFLLGLFGGALGQNLFIGSLALTSATFAAAMSNLIPAVTFILLIILRLERLAIRTMAGTAKLIGTVLSIGGAMVLTFYKGREISLWSTNINLAKHNDQGHLTRAHHSLGNQALGSILALVACLSYAIWYILQAKMNEIYPYKYSSTALMCSTASIQATVYAIITERNWSAWKLGWNIRLLTALYTGAISTGLMIVVMTWCIRLKGPLFVSIFNPFALVYVAIVGSLILNERLHQGSILGSVLIMGGVYIALWGKAKEMKNSAQLARPMESEAVEVTSN